MDVEVDEGDEVLIRVGACCDDQGAGSLTISSFGCAAPDVIEPIIENANVSFHAVRDLNESGEVCGHAGPDAFRWTPETGLLPIALPPPYIVGESIAINARGQVAGGMREAGPGHHELFPFLATDGIAAALPLPEEPGLSSVNGINDDGVVVGSFNPSDGLFAARWSRGTVEVLALPFGPSSVAFDVNNSGQVWGWMGQSPSPPFVARPFILDPDGRVTEVVLPAGTTGQARSINDFGAVCGYYFNSLPGGGGLARAFVWADGLLTTIEPPLGHPWSVARRITNDGVVLCSAGASVDGEVQFLWKDGQIILLSQLVSTPSETSATFTAINAAHQLSMNLVNGEPSGPSTITLARVSPLPPDGDIDCDGMVGGADLGLLLAAWGPCTPTLTCPADVVRDGVVDGADLGVVLAQWRR